MTVLALLLALAFAWTWGWVYREPLVQRNRVAYWFFTVIVLAAAGVFAASGGDPYLP